tara:strand:+ start:411 stop:626 length:216 start_codon:yes stop_codon:yes gene_type:complete
VDTHQQQATKVEEIDVIMIVMMMIGTMIGTMIVIMKKELINLILSLHILKTGIIQELTLKSKKRIKHEFIL